VEVENTAAGVVHRDTARGKRPPALSLAQEFELLAPEEFAQTGEICLFKHIPYMYLYQTLWCMIFCHCRNATDFRAA